jgi:serine/threonine-protein phosphatase 2A regulatory subunit B''
MQHSSCLFFFIVVETVICRIYYEGKCPTGRMRLSQFRKCQFTQMIQNLGPEVDLNNVKTRK